MLRVMPQVRRPLLVLVALGLLLVGGYAVRQWQSDPPPGTPAGGTSAPASVVGGGQQRDSGSGLPVVALSGLPAQARETYQLIRRGGPYPYDRDGVVFGNREGLLPRRAAGYYHEYTVRTPGSSDRGARRIIAGGSGEVYYTGDHYASFVYVDVSR